MSFINQLSCGGPCWLILAGTAIAALTSGLIIRRRRRVKRLSQYKARARLMLMEVRRACTLPRTALPLHQVPGMIHRIRKIAESAGFALEEIGASERQMERFLMTAKDGKVPDRRSRSVGLPSTETWWAKRDLERRNAQRAIELPLDGGGIVATAAGTEKPAELRESRSPGESWFDFGGETAEPYDDIVIEVDPSDDRPAEEPAATGRWFSREDLAGGTGPGIDEMFDRIIRSDEEALDEPAKTVIIRVDGKKFGL